MKVLAPNTQTWWDAICNFDPVLNKDNIAHPSVLSDKQYRFYQELRKHNHVPATYSMNEEEQFMYVCFMAAFHNEL